jgi:hypothetical protein
MFSFDWERVQGQTVKAILARRPSLLNNGTTKAEAIYLCVAGLTVVIEANIDTDELALTLIEGPRPRRLSPLTPLQDLVGRPLGWAWEGRNYLGYEDCFLVSFSGDPVDDPRHNRTSPLDPDVMFIGCASSVQMARLRQV